MRTIPLLKDRPRELQVLLAGVAPAVTGFVAGLMLGVSAAAYWIVNLIAAIGGVAAGLEHENGWKGADRGLLGGTIFGIFLLIAHALGGAAKVKLPGFEPLLVIVTAIGGMLLGALGGRLRRVVVKPPADEQPAAAEADPET